MTFAIDFSPSVSLSQKKRKYANIKKQPTSKDVLAENDGVALDQYFDSKTIVKSTLKLLAYLIFFRILPGIYPSRTAILKKNYD